MRKGTTLRTYRGKESCPHNKVVKVSKTEKSCWWNNGGATLYRCQHCGKVIVNGAKK